MSIPRAIVLLFLVILGSCNGANAPEKKLRILAIFAHLGKSHFDVFKPLLEELARRGHDLTVISHFPRTESAIAKEPLPNYNDIDLRDDKYGVFVNVVDLKIINESPTRMFKELFSLYRMGSIACETGLKISKWKHLIDSRQKFDVVLTESFNTNCFMALAYQFHAPIIEISTHQLMPWAINDFGLSHEASYIPTMLTRLPRPMDFVDKVWNVITLSFLNTMYDTVFHWRDQSIAKEVFGPNIPDVRDIAKNATMIMVNTHYTLHGSIPFPPNVVEVGGLHIATKKSPLPKDIAKFLDEATEGVLYFNLGSMVKTASMSEEQLKAVLKVFATIPRKVIWKWETDELPPLPGNVFVKKWLPQADILGHPNVKCYFGHGGLLGVSEGVYNGVPMILMPLYGDQYQNAMAAKARGAAIILRLGEFSEDSLRAALNEVFNNTRYMENARKLSKAYKDRPATALETAVWWTEYIARGNGLPYLKSEESKMSWCKRNLVDVAAFLIGAALIAFYIIYLFTKRFVLPRVLKDCKKKTD